MVRQISRRRRIATGAATLSLLFAGAVWSGCDADTAQDKAESLREKAEKIGAENQAIDDAVNEAGEKFDEAMNAAEDEVGIPCSVSTDC